jgi:hypothetical protein
VRKGGRKSLGVPKGSEICVTHRVGSDTRRYGLGIEVVVKEIGWKESVLEGRTRWRERQARVRRK